MLSGDGETMRASWGYLGANFGKRAETTAPAEPYLREKAVLNEAKKYYSPEEFDKLMADLNRGLLTVRVFDDGIVIGRMGKD